MKSGYEVQLQRLKSGFRSTEMLYSTGWESKLYDSVEYLDLTR